MKASQQFDDLGEALDELLRRRMLAGYQLRDEGANTRQLPCHRRADAKRRGACCGLGFMAAVNSEQFGSLARQTHDVTPAVDRYDIVAIGDAPLQRTQFEGLVRPRRKAPCESSSFLQFE